jgi:hypothetical protein
MYNDCPYKIERQCKWEKYGQNNDHSQSLGSVLVPPIDQSFERYVALEIHDKHANKGTPEEPFTDRPDNVTGSTCWQVGCGDNKRPKGNIAAD